MEEKKNNNRTWLWLLIGLLIAALIVGGILCWKKGGFDYRKNTPTEVVAPVIVPVPEPVAEPVVETVAPQGPRFHVIAGSFSIESNADNFMAKVKREHPELTPEKVVNPRNGYKMVSIFNAPTERQAYNKMNQYWDIDLYLWVYEQK
jgi:hypothetical protein